MSKPILVVEDNDDLSLLFKLVLESSGYQVVIVNNGRDALEYLEKTQPQLVVMDIMMPGMSGLQVTHTIKENLNYHSLPVILVSAIDRLNDEQLFQSQADDIIYKPFDIDDLSLKVAELTF